MNDCISSPEVINSRATALPGEHAASAFAQQRIAGNAEKTTPGLGD
jgi:hypothetical protein